MLDSLRSERKNYGQLTRKFTLIFGPAIIFILFFCLIVAIGKIEQYIFFAILLMVLAWGLCIFYFRQYWKDREIRVREFGDVSSDPWGTIYWFFLGSLLFLAGGSQWLSQDKPVEAIGSFVAAGFASYAIWKRHTFRQRSKVLLDSFKNSPPAIHAELAAEINEWEKGELLASQQSLADVLGLSKLLVSEGSEFAKHREAIGTYYAGPVRDLVSDLVMLRRLLRGEVYLTDEQSRRIDTLKSGVDRRKDDLWAFYQRILR